MNAQKLFTLTAASMITLVTLATLNVPVQTAPPSHIDGIRVVELAPVVVHPSAEDRRAAAQWVDPGIAGAMLTPALDVQADTRAGLLGAQLAMPYYSFGANFARASKD